MCCFEIPKRCVNSIKDRVRMCGAWPFLVAGVIPVSMRDYAKVMLTCRDSLSFSLFFAQKRSGVSAS